MLFVVMGYIGNQRGESIEDFPIFTIVICGKRHFLVDAQAVRQMDEVNLRDFRERLRKETLLGTCKRVNQPDLDA